MAKEQIKTIPMVRGDRTADVHPAEVDNYAQHGWEKSTPVVKEKKPRAKKSAEV